jgi:hypothetical protein
MYGAPKTCSGVTPAGIPRSNSAPAVKTPPEPSPQEIPAAGDAGRAMQRQLSQSAQARVNWTQPPEPQEHVVKSPQALARLALTSTGQDYIHLTLEGHPFTAEDLEHLPPGTTSMCIYDSQITDAMLAKIGKLPHLHTLELEGLEHLRGTGLAKLAPLTQQLRNLKLLGAEQLTDHDVEQHLAHHTSLQTLNLGFCARLTDLAAQHLSGLTNLEKLSVRGWTHLSNRGLTHLVPLKKLQELDIGWCPQIQPAWVQELVNVSPQLKRVIGTPVEFTTVQVPVLPEPEPEPEPDQWPDHSSDSEQPLSHRNTWPSSNPMSEPAKKKTWPFG